MELKDIAPSTQAASLKPVSLSLWIHWRELFMVDSFVGRKQRKKQNQPQTHFLDYNHKKNKGSSSEHNTVVLPEMHSLTQNSTKWSTKMQQLHWNAPQFAACSIHLTGGQVRPSEAVEEAHLNSILPQERDYNKSIRQKREVAPPAHAPLFCRHLHHVRLHCRSCRPPHAPWGSHGSSAHGSSGFYCFGYIHLQTTSGL